MFVGVNEAMQLFGRLRRQLLRAWCRRSVFCRSDRFTTGTLLQRRHLSG